MSQGNTSSEFETLLLSQELRSLLASWAFLRLTPVQALAIEAGVGNGKSLLVSSPTSSGKTLIGELASFSSVFRGERTIYFVSHKALADQKFLDFQEKAKCVVGRDVTVGLSTGDRDDGPINADILVTTYEKGLALILANQISLTGTTFIADEFQILCESGRGPDIEILASITKRELTGQFVALSATLGNCQQLADWLDIKLIENGYRDVLLHQEIWHPSSCHRVTFGGADFGVLEIGEPYPANIFQVVARNLEWGRGPVLVFTETRREAAEFANRFAQSREITVEGITFAESYRYFLNRQNLRSNCKIMCSVAWPFTPRTSRPPSAK